MSKTKKEEVFIFENNDISFAENFEITRKELKEAIMNDPEMELYREVMKSLGKS